MKSSKLPNAEKAVVDMRKLTDYCLNFGHERGKHKARLFSSALGLTTKNAEVLRDALLKALQNMEALECGADDFGKRYRVDFYMESPKGRARIRSVWFIPKGEDFAQLTTCYVLKGD